MDNRPIGIFDSGVGGLTAEKVLEEILPNEDIIYFGDNANMPYGGRSRDEIVSIAMRLAEFFAENDVKAALAACGTISSMAIELLRQSFDFPFFGVIDASCDAAVRLTKTKKIGVIATQAAVNIGSYEARIKASCPDISVLSRACPSFAPLVEAGHFQREDKMAQDAVRAELSDFKGSGIDTLLLGCTHYPLLEGTISNFLDPGVSMVSSGGEAARELKIHLEGADMLKGDQNPGFRRFYTSGDAGAFSKNAAVFLGYGVSAIKHTL